jgi:hypothetical protein
MNILFEAIFRYDFGTRYFTFGKAFFGTILLSLAAFFSGAWYIAFWAICFFLASCYHLYRIFMRARKEDTTYSYDIGISHFEPFVSRTFLDKFFGRILFKHFVPYVILEPVCVLFFALLIGIFDTARFYMPAVFIIIAVQMFFSSLRVFSYMSKLYHNAKDTSYRNAYYRDSMRRTTGQDDPIQINMNLE